MFRKLGVGFFLYYGMRALVALAGILFLIIGDWVDAVITLLIFLVMLIPSFLRKRYELHLPFKLDLAIVSFIFLTLFLGSLRDFYERFPLWDDILHFASGFLMGMVGFLLVYLLNEQKSGRIALSPFFVAFFAACFSMAVSVVWEIYEFSADKLFGFNMQRSGLDDTMSDLIVNAVGAFIVASIAYVWMERRSRIPFTPKRLKNAESKKDAVQAENQDQEAS